MSEEQGPPGPRDRKRPGPTIDLRATELASEPVAAGPASADTERRRHDDASDRPQQTYQHLNENLRMTSPGNDTDRSTKHSSWRLLGSGAAAIVLAGGLLLLAWLAVRDSGSEALEARLAGLEQQLRDLSARPALPSADPKVTNDLAGRIA